MKISRLLRWTLALATAILVAAPASATCSGHFINPVTDICWRCVFPITLSGVRIFGYGQDDNGSSDANNLVCNCGPNWLGLPVGYWEPHYMVDVTTDPYCTPSLGGTTIGAVGLPGDAQGTVGMKPGTPGENYAFYHYVLYKNPVLSLMGAFSDNPCLDHSVFDILQFSAVNPAWPNDTLSAILSPDAFLYGSLPAILAGIPVGVCATVGGENATCLAMRRAAHWSGGFNGGVYPLTGAINNHGDPVSTSMTIIKRALTLGHRTFTIWGTAGAQAMCGYYAQPYFDTTDIKVQMTQPRAMAAPWGSGAANSAAAFDDFVGAVNQVSTAIPDAANGGTPLNLSLSTSNYDGKCCFALESLVLPWSLGKTWPVTGEDMSYMVFQKRDCCMAGGTITNAIDP